MEFLTEQPLVYPLDGDEGHVHTAGKRDRDHLYQTQCMCLILPMRKKLHLLLYICIYAYYTFENINPLQKYHILKTCPVL